MKLKYLFACVLALMCAQPALAASSPQLRTLEQELSSIVTARPGSYGIAALDLATGEQVSIAGDEPFPMASTVKIAVAANYLAQVEHGRRSLDSSIGGKPVRALMERMMINSDNHATDVLIRNLGGPAMVHTWLADNGVNGLRVDRTIAQLLAAKRDLWDVRDSSTPRAMVELLRRIDSGKLLKPESRSYLLSLMARCKTGKNRMRALLPSEARVEHKTGTLNNYTSDVGFITMPDGRRLAVAFFARGGNDRPGMIAWAARTIYDGFAKVWRNPFATYTTGAAAAAAR